MISLFPLLLSLQAEASVPRCGLAALHPPEGTTGNPVAMGAYLESIRSKRSANTVGTRLLRTRHFAIWYKLGSDSDAIEPALATIPASDSAPTLVRTIGDALEKAYSFYVDTLGMLPPLPSSDAGVIAEAPPTGLYPVEICRPEQAITPTPPPGYFGVTIPQSSNLQASRIFISSKVVGKGWNYRLDTGGTFNVDYTNLASWLNAMEATAVHELFHAVQFRYETNLLHFLFESSAVAMEDAVLPDVDDHLYYLAQLYGYVSDEKTIPMLKSCTTESYRHGLYVMGLMQDAGRSIVRKLWEDRGRNPNTSFGTILGTLRDNLPVNGLTYRESMIRYGQRMLIGGRRSNWTDRWDTIPPFDPWNRADHSPNLDKILVHPVAGNNSWPLGPGEIKLLADPPITGNLRVTWIPTGGAFLARVDSIAGAGFIRETFPPGISTIPASRRKSSLWILGSDGTDPANPTSVAYANATANLTFKQSDPAVPSSDSCHLRETFADPSGDSLVLTGCPTTTATAYEMDATLDTLPATEAIRDSIARHGKAWVLSSSPALSLRNASLSVPGRWKFAYARTGSTWKRISLRESGNRSILTWSELAIADSLPVFLSSQSVATAPFPNPSLDDQPVTFPLGADLDGLKLSIFAADGSLVRHWGSSELSFNTIWNLRNQYGFRVRPGVYTWVLSGSRSERGRLLVGR